MGGECVCIGETSEDGECQVNSDRKRRDACDDENMEKNEAGECVCIGETSEDGECMSGRKRRDVCDDENMEKMKLENVYALVKLLKMGNVKLRVIAKEEMPAMMKTWKRMKLENVYAL